MVGKNGSGKTNLVEAVYLLSLCKSWRTNDIRTLINKNSQSSFVRAYVRERGIDRKIEILLSGQGKKISLDDKPVKKLSELSNVANVIVFSPDDVNLMKGSPSSRRNFLDVSISKEFPEYLSMIGKYGKLLSERNAALKEMDVDRKYLDVLTSQMIALSEPITRYREKYISRLNKILSQLANSLYDENRNVLLVYKPFIKGDNFINDAKKAYERNLENDIIRKMTNVGIHREDFSLLLDGNDISVYGSQGENRLASIALKISPFFLIEDIEKKPITILDDVYSELDARHSQRLTNLLKKLGQVFVTTTEDSIEGDAVIEVSDETAKRRK